MSNIVPVPMTSDDFFAWAIEQPEGQRHELVAGEIVATALERSAHALNRFLARRLAEAVERDGLSCNGYSDGMAVEIDATTTYEPDAMVKCHAMPPPDTIKLNDPIIIAEVLPPSSRPRHSGAKLADYFWLPSMHHDLIVRTEDQVIIHHAHQADETILPRIVREETPQLDPRGLILHGLFPSPR